LSDKISINFRIKKCQYLKWRDTTIKRKQLNLREYDGV
jgi:hypothetical protein